MSMTPIEWQVWNFGVILAFAKLGISVGLAYVPGIVVSIIGLLFLYRIHEQDKRKINNC